MLAYIEGRILERTEQSCIVVTREGIGYEIFIPTHTLMTLPAMGEEFYLYLAHIVREDAQELFGFQTWDERQTFKMLITINRVGARTALSILSQFRPDDLRHMVAKEDMLGLTQVSGIGKQTGQKIFLELQYKMKGEAQLISSPMANNSLYQDTLTGLLNLGYEENQVSSILKNILQEQPDLSVGEALRASLKAIAKNK